MWIQVRTMDGKKSGKITSLSKLTKIEFLRQKIQEILGYEAEKQRIFFNGKQLENGYTLFDYNVTLNSLVQVMERTVRPTPPVDDEDDLKDPEPMEERELSDSDSGIDEEKKKASGVRLLPSLGIYKINELVDAQDKDMGAWFEAIVMKVEIKDEKSETKSEENTNEDTNNDFCIPVTIQKQTLMENFVAPSTEKIDKQLHDDNKENVAPSCSSSAATSNSEKDENSSTVDEIDLVYHVKFEEYDQIHQLPSHMIRPRARRLLEWSDFKEYDMVMANYNPDQPKERGFWYDCVVLEKNMKRRYKELTVEVLLGPGRTLQPCKIVFVEEIFGIETPGSNNKAGDEQNVPRKRNTLTDPECSSCNDNPRKKCKDCGCHVCGEKKDFDKTLLCDECNLPFHTFCLDPPLDGLPEEDEWYCPLCRNDHTEVVKAGEKLKASKKKSKMKSTNSTTQRDWGKGMACVGRSRVCSIVPSNHFGPIPGIPVGSLWKFRMQVSEAGIHRPHVSGIHGKSEDGAYSIVLAGGYEDDEDNGELFTYTGSGGRDLSGNKRTAEQSCDQILTKNNLAIARTCDAKVDTKKGNVANDWKRGKPIRVVRSYKGAKHSKYAPEDGNRYDGIYKVVKYWPEKGKSGFIVWRYELRRDDPEHAPWTKEGKKRIKELGLTLQYPDGYLETQASKLAEEEEKKGKKRKRDSDTHTSPNKKVKAASYKIDSEVRKVIKLDEINGKYWREVVKCSKEGQAIFFKKLEETFMCICCQDVVYQPITTECLHNICKSCLKRSFNADVFSCPTCRFDLGKSYKFVVNENLQKVLLKLFPGYENGR